MASLSYFDLVRYGVTETSLLPWGLYFYFIYLIFLCCGSSLPATVLGTVALNARVR